MTKYTETFKHILGPSNQQVLTNNIFYNTNTVFSDDPERLFGEYIDISVVTLKFTSEV